MKLLSWVLMNGWESPGKGGGLKQGDDGVQCNRIGANKTGED